VKSAVKLRRVLDVCKIVRAESKACQSASLRERPVALYFRSEHLNENETARCEYYDVACSSHGGRRRVAKFADKVAGDLDVEFRWEQLLAHKNSSSSI